MKILLTGGAGFVGSAFARLATADRLPGLEGAELVVLDALTYFGSRARLAEAEATGRCAFVQGDVRDTAMLDRLLPDVDAVVHAAAEHGDARGQDASVLVETNVVGTQRLLDASIRHGVRRFLHLSTLATRGVAPGQEAAPTGWAVASQASSELLVSAAWRAHGLDARILRGDDAYGPFQSPEAPVGALLAAAADDATAPEPDAGSWLHVDDLARGVAALLTAGAPGAVAELTGEPADGARLREMVDAAQAGAPTSTGAGPIPLDAGIADALAWYREHRSWWEPLQERVAL